MARYDFEGLPAKALAIIALRAAMRVLPVLAFRKRSGGEHALATLRCYQASAFVNSLTKADNADAADAADAARSAADAADRSAYDAADAAAAVRYAAARSTFAAAAALSAADADDDDDAADAARSAAHDSADTARYAADTAHAAAQSAADAISRDIEKLRGREPSLIERAPGHSVIAALKDPADLMTEPLWLRGTPSEIAKLWAQAQLDLRSLGAGFEVWFDWYQDRLDGKPFDWEIERQWALLSKEQLAQSPAEINAYLKALRDGALTKQLKRVRAIFIGPGEVGKTSLINVFMAGKPNRKDQTTKGVATKDAQSRRRLASLRE